MDNRERVTVLALDPGNIQTGYCLLDSDTLHPIRVGKELNATCLLMVQVERYDFLVIERVASYGMPVGREVLETCEWVGRYTQAATAPVGYIYRKEVVLHICNSPRGNDAAIRRALIDRFAIHDRTNGKGSKKHPDFFFGFRADMWAAYAAGLAYIETKGGQPWRNGDPSPEPADAMTLARRAGSAPGSTVGTPQSR